MRCATAQERSRKSLRLGGVVSVRVEPMHARVLLEPRKLPSCKPIDRAPELIEEGFPREFAAKVTQDIAVFETQPVKYLVADALQPQGLNLFNHSFSETA